MKLKIFKWVFAFVVTVSWGNQVALAGEMNDSLYPVTVERVIPPLISSPSKIVLARPVRTDRLSMSSVVLADIYLAQDRQTIAGETAALLAETAELMEKESGWSLQLEAHCDDRGTAAYGLVVGEERVRKIKTILKDMGVLATQLMSTSYGLEQPLCGEATSMCWEENLRTMWAIRLLDYDHSQTGCLVRLRLVTPQNFARALRYSRTKPFLQRIQYAEPSISFVYEGQESSSFFGNR